MRMLRRIASIKFGVLFVMLFSTAAFGQETAGSIEGAVKDSAGAIVPNVTVTISSREGSTGTTTGSGYGFRRTVTTDSEGVFRVLQVPPGVYDVVTAPTGGFGEARYEKVSVAIGSNTQLTITVNPGGTVNTVDVTVSDAPPVDTSSNAIQSTISAQKIELLPKGTGFTSLLKTIPGTRPESRTGGFSVDGASGSENVFVIDGQEVTNYRTGSLNETFNLPTQLVQEVQVKSSGFNAEYGGATGGVVSVATRGGNNDFHGEFGMQFDTPKFAGTPRPLLTRFTSGTTGNNNFVQTAEYFAPEKTEGTNVFPTANLGGKIIKDRLWFFGSYSPQIYKTDVNTQYLTNLPASTRTFVASQLYSRERTYAYAFGRLDSNPFDNLRLSGTFLWNPVVDEGSLPGSTFSSVSSSSYVFNPSIPTANFGGTIGVLPESQFRPLQGGRQTANSVTLSGTYTPTSSLVIDGRYSRGFLNEKNGNYFVPTLLPQVSSCSSNTAAFPCATSGANTITAKDVSIRTTYEFSGTYLFKLGGRHELKGGYQRYTILNDVQSGNNAIGQLRFFVGTPISSTQPGVTDTLGAIGSGSFRRQGTNGRGSNLSQGIFIQDKYQLFSRLTLNLGVRIEKEDLPSFNQYPSAINFGWGDKIAPRLGFAYDIFGDGGTKIFASYGRFFDRVKFALPRGLFGGDVFLEDYFEIFPGDTVASFNIGTVVGGFSGPSVCPATGPITPGVRSRCQRNLRVNANEPGAGLYTGFGAVDPALEPFQQTEFTVGGERQLSRDYVFRVRYTFKNVDQAVEDAGFVNTAGSEAYIIGNPGQGLHLEGLKQFGYINVATPQRRYDGLEFTLDKRLSKNWYFNANYTYSRLFGNYTGLSSSDEPHLVDGRLAPGVSRAFDLPFIGFTAEGKPDNGLLPTDRPHVFNIYGAYIFDWIGGKANSTEISAFQTVASGAPMTTSIFGQSSVTPQVFYHRGDLGRSPTFTQTDLNLTHRYRFGKDDGMTVAFDLNFLNLWDQDTVTGIYPTMNTTAGRPNDAGLGLTPVQYANGYTTGALLQTILTRIAASPDRPDLRYKQPQLYQSPRAVRFGFRFLF
ncbi:MAG: carboxypeptidase regulatory-like domain-containing protein [Pyrinomonadaceae bacterium]